MFLKFQNFLVTSLATLFLISCSGIQMIDTNHLYRKEFTQKLEAIKKIYLRGDSDRALFELNALEDDSLNKNEQAAKYNLSGVINFSQKKFQIALDHLNKALDKSKEDAKLVSQINLNLGSTYYKLNKFEQAYSSLQAADTEKLSESEQGKYYQLKLILSQQLGYKDEAVLSSIMLLKNADSFEKIKESNYSTVLTTLYKSLDPVQRQKVFSTIENEKWPVVAYVAKMEANDRYFKGRREASGEMIKFLKDNFFDLPEVEQFLSNYETRLKSLYKIELNNVGVVLPFKGKKKNFSNKVLLALDTFLKTNKSDLQFFIKDNYANPIVSSEVIHELALEKNVSVIIGGLFSDTATEEYLTCKKLGIFYISLSQIHLPKSEKNHLLLEIPGSVQSIVDYLSKPRSLNILGPRVAVFYPNTERGRSFVNAFWQQSKDTGIQLSIFGKYPKNMANYLESIKDFLGVSFKREREEELSMWKDIYALDSKGPIRRTQSIPPIIEFDWVFLPSYPPEALQIIPSFYYFDAKKVKFVGDMSWYNKKMLKEQKNWGPVYFTGLDPNKYSSKLKSDFNRIHKRLPSLIEVISYEAVSITASMIKNLKIENREEFESEILGRAQIKGLTSQWDNKDKLWIKNLKLLKMQQGHAVENFPAAL
ncbi:hypothetical protein N9N67_11895 [Bacteriovoracaceae bacterium]|nr:hypothetical protein [Bacteriovoracaceae bacterium]